MCAKVGFLHFSLLASDIKGIKESKSFSERFFSKIEKNDREIL